MGQIYRDRNKSSNTIYNTTTTGIVSKIVRKEKEEYEITITDVLNRYQVVDIIPPGLELLVLDDKSIKLDQLLTINPNSFILIDIGIIISVEKCGFKKA
ncbi:hypothetical protein J1N35_045770 [Gossypium stocksii]|uniref:Cytochrome f n=1 Tax=Gossypium stocksii TaxID=47602 RepID=A0A9D3UBP2_9ROSI|nr:hypothetical protein J1N35_045770 [Gossypium stocksii]